jgi:hypothetical protein
MDVGYMFEDQTSSDYLSFVGSREMSEYFNDPVILKIGFELLGIYGTGAFGRVI